MTAPSVADLVGAQGKFALFVASLLQRAGVAPMTEFADLLNVFAQTVAETKPREAAILSEWASGVQGTPDADR